MSVSRDWIESVIEALRVVDAETLGRVADEAGISARTLWRYRKGETFPTMTRARLIARALGLGRR